MLSINHFKCEYLSNNCVTDNTNPRFSFTLESDRNNTETKSATYFYKYKTRDPKILSYMLKQMLIGGRTRKKCGSVPGCL